LLDVCIFAYFVSKGLACKAVWPHGFLKVVLIMHATNSDAVAGAPGPSPQPLLAKMEVGTYVWIPKCCGVLSTCGCIIYA